MDRRLAVLLYLALSVPFGIAVHLGSELAGLGRDADDLAFSPIHGYLLLIALAAAGTFLVAGGFFAGSHERRRRMRLLVRALPFGGRGPMFLAFSASLQFGFFLVTQLGEGCPLCRGDMAMGIVAALIASAIGAALIAAFGRGIARIVAALSGTTVRRNAGVLPCKIDCDVPEAASAFLRFPSVRGNRPPPQPLLA
ncbi:MAG TPA: hypothetical protein VGF86_05715 [Candidatus Tumulicola sp.]|jgi:hypothetical protein